MNDLSRRPLMQRLNRSTSLHDAEEAASLADNQVYGNFGTWACVIVILMALSMVGFRALLTSDEPAEQPVVVQTYLRADFCMTCHYGRTQPVIKDLKGYKKAHPALSQKRLLQDLVASTGEKP